jgi:hypothetical protein
MEIQLFNSIFFWKKYFKDLLKIFIIELKEKIYYYYLKLIILYPGVLIVSIIISLNVVSAVTYGDILTDFDESKIYPNYIAQLKEHTYVEMTDLEIALSIASFEPNPEYLYLYRLERKIELINLLIQKIKVKNTTHLNLDWTKTKINQICGHYVMQCHINKQLLYAKLYDPNLYNLEAKTMLDYEESNKITQIMVGEDSVLSKFDQALQMITFADSEILCKSTLPIYDCRLLFGEKQGLINFSNRYQNFTYMDLCTLECFVGQIVHLLMWHYWILPENVDLEGECYLTFDWPTQYFISMNGDEIKTTLGLWKRSITQVGLVKTMLEILVEIMGKEDSYSVLMQEKDYHNIERFVELKKNGQEIGEFRTDIVEFEDNLRSWGMFTLGSLVLWLYQGK